MFWVRIGVRTNKIRGHFPDFGIKKCMQRNIKLYSQNDFPYSLEQLIEIILNDELADFKKLLEKIHKELIK